MIDRRQFLVAAAAAAACGIAGPAWPASGDDRFAAVIARLRGYVEEGKLPFASIRIAR